MGLWAITNAVCPNAPTSHATRTGGRTGGVVAVLPTGLKKWVMLMKECPRLVNVTTRQHRRFGVDSRLIHFQVGLRGFSRAETKYHGPGGKSDNPDHDTDGNEPDPPRGESVRSMC